MMIVVVSRNYEISQESLVMTDVTEAVKVCQMTQNAAIPFRFPML